MTTPQQVLDAFTAWEASRQSLKKFFYDHRGFELDAVFESTVIKAVNDAFQSLHEAMYAQFKLQAAPQADIASEAFSAMAAHVPFDNGWKRLAQGVGEVVSTCAYPCCYGEQPSDGSCCHTPFTFEMAEAAEKYFRSVGPNAHSLPALFRWSDCYLAMQSARPSAPSPEAVPDAIPKADILVQCIVKHCVDKSIRGPMADSWARHAVAEYRARLAALTTQQAQSKGCA